MGNTQYYVASSLDGFIADADHRLDWLFQFDGAEGVAERYTAFMAEVGAIVMGARTYEFLLRGGHAWPYGDTPTWVFTHRELPHLNGARLHFCADEVGVAHADMVRAAAGRNVWLVGGGDLAAQFLAQGLVDELLVTMAPVFLGAGAPLLPASVRTPLELTGTHLMGAGLVELRYRFRRG